MVEMEVQREVERESCEGMSSIMIPCGVVIAPWTAVDRREIMSHAPRQMGAIHYRFSVIVHGCKIGAAVALVLTAVSFVFCVKCTMCKRRPKSGAPKMKSA